MVGMWLGENRSCSCLAVLPDTAWVLLNKIYQPFFTSLYCLLVLSCAVFLPKSPKLGEVVSVMDLSGAGSGDRRRRLRTTDVPLTLLGVLARSAMVGKWKCWAGPSYFPSHPLFFPVVGE